MTKRTIDGRKVRKSAFAIALTVLIVLVGVLVLNPFRTVDAGEACAVVRFGKIVGTAGPGLHVVPPVVTKLYCFTTRAAVYETSNEPGQSLADYTDFPVTAQTSDGQPIEVTFSVRWRVLPENVGNIYALVGENDAAVNERVVKFHSRNVVRLDMQNNSASKLYSGEIFDVEQNIADLLTPLFADKYVVMDKFAIRKVSFQDAYIDAIERQQIAQENIETAEYEAQAATYTAQKTVELAKGDATAEIERAKGYAQAEIERAKGDAAAIEERGKALRQYPEILQLEFIQQLENAKWLTLPQNIVPFMDLTPTETPTE